MKTSTHWKPRFFTLWTGQAFSLFGSQLVQFALIWHLTEKTDSATTLATASLVGLLPQVFLSPLIGTLVDRWNRQLILLVSDGSIALATIVLAVLFAAGRAEIWHIYVLMFVRAVGDGFHRSAFGASVVLLVPKDNLARVQGLNQSLQGGLNILSAPLGALLLQLLSMSGILAIDVGTAALAVIPLLIFGLPTPPQSARANTPQSIWADMRDGARYIWNWPALVVILAMVTIINFMFTPSETLLPLLVTRHFRGGALQLSWFLAANGIGVILGGVLLSLWGGFKRRIVTAQTGLIVSGLSVVLTGLAPDSMLWLALTGTFFTGLLLPIVNGSYGAVLQASIAPDMQGRVFAFILSLASAISPVSLMLAGPFADAVGVRPWLVMGGSVCAALGALGLFIPTVMGFEDHAS